MQEHYDVLNKYGDKTGKVLAKDEVHAKGLWHASVHVWIVDLDGNILLQYRAANKKIFPSCWDTSVAGHVSAGKSPEQTALREIKEEIGLDVAKEDLRYLGEFSEKLPWLPGGKHREHNTVFGLKIDFKLSDLKIQKDELTDLKLVTSPGLKAMLLDPVKRKELSGHADDLFNYAISFAKR